MNGDTLKAAAIGWNRRNLLPWFFVFGFLLCAFVPASDCRAVTSKIVRFSTSADFAKGTTEDTIVGSEGTIQLGKAWEKFLDQFEDAWSINSVVVNGGKIYIGTSPNGAIFKYSLGQLTKIYPTDQNSAETESEESSGPDTEDANTVDQKQYLSNEHIFAMALDMSGRLMAGISGDKCRLIRFEGNMVETILEPNDARYIFAITTDNKGNVYLATGPEGKVYRYDPFSPAATGLLYDSTDKNILSLAVDSNGFVYAGSDTRGLIYRIDPKTKTASVLYDSGQPEITALLFADGQLYAAATSARMAQMEQKAPATVPLAGKTEVKAGKKNRTDQLRGGRKLEIPGTRPDGDSSGQRTPPGVKLPKPSEGSHIYKITSQGYVTDIFSETVVLFCTVKQKENLLIGTGNSAQLYMLDPDTEDKAVVFEDKHASQITAIALSDDSVYLGMSNPAKLIKLSPTFAKEGTYISDLVDAGQPANWGKLQIEADIPAGCRIRVASRSGNVHDVNDPTFSQWTDPVEAAGPVQLTCPLARFCQYKLILSSDDGAQSPVVREMAVASTIPNLAPRVLAVTVGRIEAASKQGYFKIAYKGEDTNGDQLIYKIDFKKLGRSNWIELKDQLEADSFEWDGKAVEDGRYEIRVTASDERGNNPQTKLTGSRVSDPVIVDNTGPAVENVDLKVAQKEVTLKLQAVDQLSAIGKAEFTVDSNSEWKGILPDDLVFDTTDEPLTIMTGPLKPGDHTISVKVTDQVGNTTYKTFEVTIPGN